jgi:hypothetical protein
LAVTAARKGGAETLPQGSLGKSIRKADQKIASEVSASFGGFFFCISVLRFRFFFFRF